MTVEKPRIRIKAISSSQPAFFCWEWSHPGRWIPCIYYDDEPIPTRDGAKVQRSKVYPIDPRLDFPALRRLYPAPPIPAMNA